MGARAPANLSQPLAMLLRGVCGAGSAAQALPTCLLTAFQTKRAKHENKRASCQGLALGKSSTVHSNLRMSVPPWQQPLPILPGENPGLSVQRPGSMLGNCLPRTSSMPRTSHMMSEHQHLLQKEPYPKRICCKPKHNKGGQRVRAAQRSSQDLFWRRKCTEGGNSGTVATMCMT